MILDPRYETGAAAESVPRLVEEVDDVRASRGHDVQLLPSGEGPLLEQSDQAVLLRRPVFARLVRGRSARLARLLLGLFLLPVLLALDVDLCKRIGQVQLVRRAAARVEQHLERFALGIAVLAVA